MKRTLSIVGMILLMLTVLPYTQTALHAQDDEGDQVTDMPIGYDTELTETITETSFFDLYRFSGSQGEVIVVTVTAEDGLAPLIGLLNPLRELVAVSEDGTPDSRIELEYTLPETGEYVINVTRVGRDQGTTTGTYTLLLRRASGGDVQVNPLQPVTFRCGVDVVTTVATVEFSQPSDSPLLFEVYGFDDFRPYIRLTLDIEAGFDECSNDAQQMGGNMVMMPDGETLTLPDGDPLNGASFGVSGIPEVTRVGINIGSADAGVGRYLLIIRGLSIAPAGDEDVFDVRLGPLVAETTALQVYMVADGASRIDPYLTVSAEADPDAISFTCDDAGQRECDAIQPIIGTGVVYAESGESVLGNRFSSGIEIATGDIDSVGVRAISRAETATGNYALLIIGELPAGQNDLENDTDENGDD